MKVMHIGEYVKGGVATYINNVISFQDANMEIEELSLILSKNNSDISINLDEENIFYYDYWRSPTHFFSAIKTIAAYIKEKEPDIIHVHSTFAGVFARLPFLFTKNRPIVVYCSHGWSFLMEIPKYKKKIFACMETILSLTTDLIINISKNEFKKSLEYKIPENKSTIIYNGITNYKELQHVNFKVDLSKINILFIGRFDRQKGLDILLKFFEEYTNENIELYVIGDGILGNQNITMPKNVISLGWIDNNLLDAYYDFFDAVIIPSRWEGFGLVGIEAMKNKKAVIASNRGALPEIVKNEFNGLIFDLDNLITLENILNKIDKKKLKEYGENGYNEFRKKYTSQVMNEEILNEYKKLLEKSISKASGK